MTGATRPTVIRIRVDGLTAASFAELVHKTLETLGSVAEQGVVVSVTEDRLRYQFLPLRRRV